MEKFFFINSYDNITGALVASAINQHPDVSCAIYDPHLLPQFQNLLINDFNHTTIDKLIKKYSSKEKKFCGLAQRFSSFELHHRTLVEKTVQPFKSVTLIVDPVTRINLLLHSWMNETYSADFSISYIEEKLQLLNKQNHALFSLNNFPYLHNVVTKQAKEKFNINYSIPKNRLFILALSLLVTHDTADLPVPCKSVSFEKLLSNPDNIDSLLRYISRDSIHSDQAQNQIIVNSLSVAFNKIKSTFTEWEQWQHDLLHYFLQTRIQTIYYPHLNKSLSELYASAGYINHSTVNENSYSKLISIHLNSNRPAQLCNLFDNIEETADKPSDIEVIINVDNDDHIMKSLLLNEVPKRKFTLKYTETKRPNSFCDLWKPLNTILQETDPNCYFLLNISDEMLFATQGWDTILKKYVGFFPDHLFRLRASRNKLRNYFDRWECNFAQDSIPITTKRWVDIGGDWNPCFGPDSYQQLISYYLNQDGKYSCVQYNRDIPLFDIKFMGDIPSIGLDPHKAWKHTENHAQALFICQSHKMQQEAKRRAMLIKANIFADDNQINDFNIIDHKIRKIIEVYDNKKKQTAAKYHYKLSWIAITVTNQWRKLFFHAHFGDGKGMRTNPLKGFLKYLKMRYRIFNHTYLFNKNLAKKIIKRIKSRKSNALLIENLRLRALYSELSAEVEKSHIAPTTSSKQPVMDSEH